MNKSPPRRPGLKDRVRGASQQLIQLEDTPHSIALGVAIGTFVAYLPIVGFQMIVGAIACRIARANVIASVPMAWITNPVTIPFIFFGTYKLGVVFIGGEKTYEDIKMVFAAIGDMGFWRGAIEGYRLLLEFLWPMIIGGTIVGIINGFLFYILVRKFLSRDHSDPDKESA